MELAASQTHHVQDGIYFESKEVIMIMTIARSSPSLMFSHGLTEIYVCDASGTLISTLMAGQKAGKMMQHDMMKQMPSQVKDHPGFPMQFLVTACAQKMVRRRALRVPLESRTSAPCGSWRAGFGRPVAYPVGILRRFLSPTNGQNIIKHISYRQYS